MQLLYLFTIAFLNSIDNIGVGISYSIAGIKIKLPKNILIAFLAFAVSFITSLSGVIINYYINETICSITSMLLLVSTGSIMIFRSFYNKENSILNLKEVNYKEALSVGIALALDDMGSSLSSSLLGYNPFLISMPYFIISLIIFFSSNYEIKFSPRFRKKNKATMFAGVIMIMLGLAQLFS